MTDRLTDNAVTLTVGKIMILHCQCVIGLKPSIKVRDFYGECKALHGQPDHCLITYLLWGRWPHEAIHLKNTETVCFTGHLQLTEFFYLVDPGLNQV